MQLHYTCVFFIQSSAYGWQKGFQSASPAQDGWGGVMGGDLHGPGQHRGDQVLGEAGREAHLANQRQRERHLELSTDECENQRDSESKFLKVSSTNKQTNNTTM